MIELLHMFEWEIVSGVTSILSVIFTTILTFLIIRQTNRLTKIQQKTDADRFDYRVMMEKNINDSQLFMQNRQLMLDKFAYKLEIYEDVYKVMEFVNSLQNLILSLEKDSMTGKQLTQAYLILKENTTPNQKEIMRNLLNSEVVFDEPIRGEILKLRTKYDKICSHLISLETVEKIIIDSLYDKELAANTIESNLTVVRSKCTEIVGMTPALRGSILSNLRSGFSS
jgi:uncharacterized membrane-anchored protein YhcB (DUF1043 family)